MHTAALSFPRLLLMSLSLAMIAGFGISVQAQKAPGVTVGGVQITGGLEMFGDQGSVLLGRCRVT